MTTRPRSDPSTCFPSRLWTRLAPVILALASRAAIAAPLDGVEVVTIAGTGQAGSPDEDAPAAETRINQPFGVIGDEHGGIYFCDTANHAVRRIDARSGRITTVAGAGRPGYAGDDGPATEALLNEPYEVRFGSDGTLFVVERLNHTIRRIDARSGRITTIAGTGQPGYGGDGGPATRARLNQPHAIEPSPDGRRLFVCDIGNHRLRAIDLSTGIISTVGGTGEPKMPPDQGPIEGTPLLGPRAMAFDRDGGLWLSLREGRAILHLDLAAGTLRRVAGTGARGNAGDDGPARDAQMTGPLGMAVSPRDGNLYFCDTDNHLVRRIDPAARPPTIHRVLGTGVHGDGPDGRTPLECALDRPHGIFVDREGRLLVGDTNNHRIRRLRLPALEGS